MNSKKSLQTLARTFLAYNKQEEPVVLEWQKTTLFAQEFASVMKQVWPIARDAYTPVELNFLRAFPQVVGAEPYYKIFEPLFKNGEAAVDWEKVSETMQALLKTHFIYDASTWGSEVLEQFGKDVCFVVTVRDKKNDSILGFITFMMRPGYVPGDIKVMIFAVDPTCQGRGLGKLLMSSIFKIDPTVNRIFLCTRVTNDKALKAYRAWGFVDDEHPILDHAFNLKHWTFLEYKKSNNDILQKSANALHDEK